MSQGTNLVTVQETLDTAVSREGRSPDDFTSKVARNSAFVMVSQIAMKALGFLFNVYIVRRLGDEEFGQYAAVMAFIAIFAIFSDLGMAPYMLREIAGDRRSVYWLLPNVVVLRSILSAGVVVVSTLAAYWAGKDASMVLGVFVAACGLFIYAVQGPLDTILMGWERLDYSATFTFFSQLVFWGLGTLSLVLGWGFIGLLVASMVSVAILAFLEGLVIFREVRFQGLALSPRRWGELLKAGLPFGIGGLSLSLQDRFDSVLLSTTLTDAAVGWYNAPLQLIQTAMLLAQSFCTSLFPSLSRAYGEEQKSIYGIVQHSLKYLFMLSLPIAVGATAVADRLIVTLYTEQFARSIPLMRILSWTLPLLFTTQLMGAVALATRQERTSARINVFSGLISVGLNLVAVPTAGVFGAAWSRVAGRGIRMGLYWRLLGRELLVGNRWRELVRVGLAAGVMGAGLLLLGKTNLLLSIGAGVVLYVASLFVFRAVSREELGQLAGLLLKRKTRWSTTEDAGTGVKI